MKKLLITGFDPFGGQSVNPSWEAVRLLPERIGAYEVTCLQIPTLFGEGAQRVLSAADALHPDVILSVGQAGGRRGVTPEVVGINLREDQTATIDTVLTLDFSNMEGFVSDVTQFKTLSEADKVVFTISLQKKGDSGYEDVLIGNYLSGAKTTDGN